jgi:peptide chain release factor 2
VKDVRTKLEVGDVNRILGGDLDPFIKEYLMQKAKGTLKSSTGEPED